MTERELADESLEQEHLARQSQDGADGEGSNAAESNGNGEGEGGEQHRPRRPGKLERRLAAMERAADEARADAEYARQQAAFYQRQLAEASEAGHRFAQDGVKSRLQLAEDGLRKAIAEGDADAVVKANSELARLAAMAAQMDAQPRQPREAAPNPPAAPSYTPTTRAWLESNPWYGRDPELTGIAKAAHAAAKRQGIVVDTPEYWRFVEQGVERLVPGTIRTRTPADADDGSDDEPPPPRPAARTTRTGSPPTRTNATTPPNTKNEIRLSAEELDAAKVTGMTPQEYASWKAKLSAAGRLNTTGAR